MIVKNSNNIAVIGGYKYLEGVKGKWAGVKTTTCHAWLKVGTAAELIRNIRVSQGKILPPVSRIAFGRYQTAWTGNRTNAQLLHEAIYNAIKAGEMEVANPLLEDEQEVMSGLMYKQADIVKLIPELVQLVEVD